MVDMEGQVLRSEEGQERVSSKEFEFQNLSIGDQIKSWFVPLYAQWIWVVLSLIFLDLCDGWIQPRFTTLPVFVDPRLSLPADQETVSDDVLIVLSAVVPFVCVGTLSFFFDKAAVGINTLSMLQSYSNGLLWMTVLKKLAGKPRPCFYDMCKWDFEARVCTADKKELWKAYQSFPSGHALLSFAGLGFLSAWIATEVPQRARKRPLSPLQLQLLNLACVLPLMLAAWIGVSRMFDSLHEADDVTAGAGIGIASAGVGVWFMRQNRAVLLGSSTRG